MHDQRGVIDDRSRATESSKSLAVSKVIERLFLFPYMPTVPVVGVVNEGRHGGFLRYLEDYWPCTGGFLVVNAIGNAVV